MKYLSTVVFLIGIVAFQEASASNEGEEPPRDRKQFLAKPELALPNKAARNHAHQGAAHSLLPYVIEDQSRFCYQPRFTFEDGSPVLTPILSDGLNLPYDLPRAINDSILDFVNFQRDILNLALVCRGFFNWVDERRLKLGQKVSPKDLLNLLRNRKKLRFLSMKSSGEYTEQTMIAASGLFPNIFSLNLSGCKGITDASLKAIATNCSKLSILYLDNCAAYEFSHVGLDAIVTYCKDLTSLHLLGCSGDDDLGVIAPKLPELTSITAGSNHVSDVGINSIATNCRKLTSFSLCYNDHVSDEGLMTVLTNCRNLASITLFFCTEITGTGFIYIIKCCPTLVSIYITECIGIDGDFGAEVNLPKLNFLQFGPANSADSFLRLIAGNCSELTTLFLSEIDDLTDMTIEALAEGCKKLEKLTFEDCNKVTDRALAITKEKCKHLTSVFFDGCKQITKK